MKYQLNLNGQPIARFAIQHMAMALAKQLGPAAEVRDLTTGRAVSRDAIDSLSPAYSEWLRSSGVVRGRR